METKKIIIAGLLGGVIAAGSMHFFEKAPKIIQVEPSSDSIPVKFTNNSSVSSNAIDFTFAAEKTLNAVVHVTTSYAAQYQSDPIMDFFWGPGHSRNLPQMATGSGVIISEDGYIVTNNHVIDGADKIEVTLNDDRTFEASLIGTDPSTDLALLKVNAENLTPTSFGNSDQLMVGEWVLAVGNPFNLTSTVTAGIVSAKARNINIVGSQAKKDIFPLESFIQTDAAVNPGNSGGALVNPNGELVGINTAIASKTGSYSGYSFAIPSNLVKKVAEDLLAYGIVQRAFIGVRLQDIDQKIANELELPNLKGVLVHGLVDEGAAKAAGMKEGDVILKVGEMEISKVPELQEQIGHYRPGDKVTLTVRRQGEMKLIHIILRNQSGNTEMVSASKSDATSALGAKFKKAELSELKALRINNGVKVIEISSGKLRSSGIPEGFIISKIDKENVTSPEQVVELLNTRKGGVLIEGYYPNGMKGYFGFGL